MIDFEIRETDCYGLITNDCISLDDKNYFNNSLILVELYKIKCFISQNDTIVGMQIVYRDRKEKNKINTYITIDIKVNINCFEKIFIFEQDESLINITIWKEEYLKGFEITTNKNRKQLFGSKSGNKIMLNEFSSSNNIIVGFYTKFNRMIGLTALGLYYVSKKEYMIFLISGLFYLRAKLKNEEYYKNIENNISKIDYANKAILKLCLLPRNIFSLVIKYLIV